MNVENIIFDVAEALRVPVLVLAILAIVIVLLELGSLFVEVRRRRKRGMPRLERGLDIARAALASGDRAGAEQAVRQLGYNRSMADALGSIVGQSTYPDADERIAKRMAEYDYRSMKRLERTRILVRAGPALGLMGTLIPLSPALSALADGDVTRLTEDLRVAFSVTVVGLLIGMVAFGVSLIRDRLYSQDYSDVEYVHAALVAALAVAPKPPAAAAAAADGRPAAPVGQSAPAPGGQPAAPATTPTATTTPHLAPQPIPGTAAQPAPANPPAAPANPPAGADGPGGPGGGTQQGQGGG